MIERSVIEKVMDATNIVEVVGDFVSLKRRGSNYMGLCPFHNERTPSFSVSPSRGIFKCFSCGKAGSAITFLMELEGMSYVEAIKWLGRKYNIEVKDRELTSEEKESAAERESLYAVNEYAMKYFEDVMRSTAEGRDIGLAYFRERGINDAMIAKFHLGYSLEQFNDLYTKATAAGYDEKFLLDTGLCIKNEKGRIYDRFKGRVMYPVHTLSGRVVAFGGRTLKNEKTMAKYVNSPESRIYSKSRELYGMYQARTAISKKKQCILVEGYMDVISMHQVGVENVVASSGTSLTEGQIRMIKRFADTVILIYDSDPAGIKASLRGIDMLIKEGLSLKLVLLPEGDDPDSFAQSHTLEEVEEYISENQKDLINFKADILLKEAQNDPRKRSEAINDILGTIAMIPNVVEQSLYTDECARKVGIPTAALTAQLRRIVTHKREEDYNKAQRKAAADTLEKQPIPNVSTIGDVPNVGTSARRLKAEKEILRLIVRYGMLYLGDVESEEGGEATPMTVLDYVKAELSSDGITFAVPQYAQVYEQILGIVAEQWTDYKAEKEAEFLAEREAYISRCREEIVAKGLGSEDIAKEEEKMLNEADAQYSASSDSAACAFIRERLIITDNMQLIEWVAKLTSDRATLSKMYGKEDLREKMNRELPAAVNTLKSVILKEEIEALCAELNNVPNIEEERATALIKQIYEKKQHSMRFDLNNGEIVILPKGRGK